MNIHLVETSFFIKDLQERYNIIQSEKKQRKI